MALLLLQNLCTYYICTVGMIPVHTLWGDQSRTTWLEGYEGQDEQNPIGSSPSNYDNGGVRVGKPSVAMEIACRQLIPQSLHGTVQYKDLRGSQQKQELGFQCEKEA
jgi:hypothetical protein